MGVAIVELGGGRKAVSDEVDPWVGLSHLASVGDAVAKGQPLATLHSRTAADLGRVRPLVEAAYRVADEGPPMKLIRSRL